MNGDRSCLNFRDTNNTIKYYLLSRTTVRCTSSQSATLLKIVPLGKPALIFSMEFFFSTLPKSYTRRNLFNLLEQIKQE